MSIEIVSMETPEEARLDRHLMGITNPDRSVHGRQPAYGRTVRLWDAINPQPEMRFRLPSIRFGQLSGDTTTSVAPIPLGRICSPSKWLLGSEMGMERSDRADSVA
jgi:hypothetical protein